MTWAAQPALMAALQEVFRQRSPQGDENELYRAVEVRGVWHNCEALKRAHVSRGRVLGGHWQASCGITLHAICQKEPLIGIHRVMGLVQSERCFLPTLDPEAGLCPCRGR